MALSYVDFSRFRLLTELDTAHVDSLEARRPGFVLAHCEQKSRWIEDKLRHRYRIPFPERHSTIEGWIIAIVNIKVAVAIGVDVIDTGIELLEKQAAAAEAEVIEAAKPESPQMNLPNKDAKDESAIAKGGPRSYSEDSPYTWSRRQGRAR